MKPPQVVVTHVYDSSLAVQVDEQGRIIGLPDAVVDQIADRVIEKLKADGLLNPDPRLWGGDPHSL
jgi:Rod binding domain-containing protein